MFSCLMWKFRYYHTSSRPVVPDFRRDYVTTDYRPGPVCYLNPELVIVFGTSWNCLPESVKVSNLLEIRVLTDRKRTLNILYNNLLLHS